MKTRSLLLFAASLLFAAISSFSQQMNYQGRLTDSSGNALQDGQYTLTFDLYDAATGGAKVWGPFVYDGGPGDGHSAKVDLVNGRFNVILGPQDTDSRVLSGAFAGSRFLQITVAQNPPLMPRQQILAAPEALHAIEADHAKLADGINGSLNITGDFNVGGNATFAANVIGPTATLGTLALTGPSRFDGAMVINNSLNVGVLLRQYILAGGGVYGMGLQNNTEYFRTAGDFAWYRGGTHANAAGDAGGGKVLMRYDSTGLMVFGEPGDTASSATFVNATKGTRGSHIHYGAKGDWYIRSAAFDGEVIMQDGGGAVRIGGFVGIGGAADFPLHVTSKRSYTYNGGVGDLGNYSGGVYQHQAFANTLYSIVSDGALLGPSFQATSDRRIKDVIGASDPARDLETIQKLTVTDYRLIDKSLKGDAVQKGFIAQEVAAVIPEAVASTPNFIPDIFATASAYNYDPSKKALKVTLAKAHHLKTGDRVRIVGKAGTGLDLTVESTSSDHEFTVAQCDSDPGEVFVYGKFVPDLLNVNYDRIFSTGIGAIQELARRVKTLEENQKRFAEIQEKANRVDALEREVAQLRNLFNKVAQNGEKQTAQVIR